jgi:hypothetical protein
VRPALLFLPLLHEARQSLAGSATDITSNKAATIVPAIAMT